MLEKIVNRLKGILRPLTLTPLGVRTIGLPARLHGLECRCHELTRQLEDLRHQARLSLDLQATALIVKATVLKDQPLISVITPTHNRSCHLERMIASLQGHDYSNWELVVAMDRCSDGTEALLKAARATDGRVRAVVSTKPGAGAARNAALAAAKGSLIVYLDDDNQFAPGWLSAVAWAFTTFPDVELLYGGMVIDNPARVDPCSTAPDRLPELLQFPFQRNHLQYSNLADIGAIAHRAGLPEAVFEESLTTMADWEFLGRLVAKRDPLMLPVPSILYRTDAPDRLSRLHHVLPDKSIVQQSLMALYRDHGTHPTA